MALVVFVFIFFGCGLLAQVDDFVIGEEVVGDGVDDAVALVGGVALEEFDDSFGAEEVVFGHVFLKLVGDDFGEGDGVGKSVGREVEVVADGEHEYSFPVLGYAVVLGIEYGPVVGVAEGLADLLPLFEVWAVDFVAEGLDVLLQEEFGAEDADGFFGVPEDG